MDNSNEYLQRSKKLINAIRDTCDIYLFDALSAETKEKFEKWKLNLACEIISIFLASYSNDSRKSREEDRMNKSDEYLQKSKKLINAVRESCDLSSFDITSINTFEEFVKWRKNLANKIISAFLEELK